MPGEALTGSQLDKLGERLRNGPLALSDLQQLRVFLETLEPFAEEMFANVQALGSVLRGPIPQITRRNVKTVRSIIAKLRRQTIALRQIQDLVGCRIVVMDTIEQQEYLAELMTMFPSAIVIDHKAEPQHGYRAVHMVVRSGNQRFEIQLRTRLQDEWANIVEKIADRIGPVSYTHLTLPTILRV